MAAPSGKIQIAHESVDSKGVDTDLYSRVIPIMGAGNLKKLMGLNVLVSGMLGLGAEIAKDLILCGVGSVTVHDTENVEIANLSSNFYITEEDVGKNRALACVDKLAELNPYTATKSLTEPLTTQILSQFQVVVLTNNKSLTQLREFGDFCHSHSPAIVFIVADVRGLFTTIFTDFGPDHVIYDNNGEEPVNGIVTLISKAKPAVISTHEDKPHGLGVGDYVQFKEVRGMTEINYDPASMDETLPTAAIQVTNVLGLYGFEVDLDTTNFSTYLSHGLFTQVKVEEHVKFKSFSESLDFPGEFLISDFAKFGRAEQFHFGYQALLLFHERQGHLPAVGSESDAEIFLNIAKELNAAAKARNAEANPPAAEGTEIKPEDRKPEVHTVEEFDEKLLKTMSLISRGDLNPLCAFIGGVVAQEVLKITGKFKPITQWFHFDSLECLPEKNIEDRAVTGSRYDGQTAVFGSKFQEKLSNLNIFLVGAGALGCEFVKNFAMMGIATGDNGILHLTDMDNIEKSNLSRQFLFRPGDIGKMKSTCASLAVKKMNSSVKIKSSEIPVGVDTEDTWNTPFWNSLDLVVNALDNIKARLYVDTKCVEFLKPLLESGTQGTKANTQVIVPQKTESYGTSRDPPDLGIPMCTLKNFPHQIEHTIEWGRDKFQGFFYNSFEDANLYLLKNDDFFKQIDALEAIVNQRERLENVVKILDLSKDISFVNCVKWTRFVFEDLFHNTVAQLLFNFPLDAKTSTGALFWSGPKRAPTPLKFDQNNSEHLDFIISASNVLASNFGIKDTSSDPSFIINILKDVELPVWTPRSGVRIKAEDKDTSTVEGSEDDETVVKDLKSKLQSFDRSGFSAFHPASFEKDDDSNFHVAFMTAASNLRALNYDIPIADFQKTKGIAGRIIPAIATTTAMITGLVSLELYKLLDDDAVLERYRNSFVNLALPSFVQSEPMPCKINKSDLAKNLRCYPDPWTLWDKFIIDAGDFTFQEFIDYCTETFKMIPLSITCGRALIYNPLIPTHKERTNLKISEYVQTKVDSYSIKPGDNFIDLIVLMEDVDNDLLDVEIPDPVRFVFKK